VKARMYAAASMALSIATTLLLLKISSIQSSFNSALSEKQSEEFYLAVFGFVGIIAIAAPLFALNDYIDSRISIEWRSWLSNRLIASYFGNQSFFRLKIDSNAVDNPDQRICDDVRSFTSTSVSLAIGVLRQLFYCLAFSGLLASLAPSLVWFLLAYAAIGTMVTTAVFGKRLTRLAFEVLQREADLRFDLVRVRENAESIAFYQAQEREARLASNKLQAAVKTTQRQLLIQFWLSLWQNIYTYATILVPSLLLAPKYFSGEIRFGTITQAAFAFNRIEAALTYVVSNLGALSSLAAETERLEALLLWLERDSRHSIRGLVRTRVPELAASPESPVLSIHNFTLTTPNRKQIICRDLSMSLFSGQSLLIIGPSGCGKSSLLRAIAGLWYSGRGEILVPPIESVFFLPQRLYMPLGTLREQLCFPDTPHHQGIGDTGEDEELISLLDMVALGELPFRVGGLDADCDWSHVLSLGEQQRVGVLRLLRRKPVVAFLDEATSGVDIVTEDKLYRALKTTCDCIVSIGHRKELLKYHTHVLECMGDGSWQLQTMATYVQST
jgi:putative ATP-binding cassette transporter